jgi:hypothetical protein
MAAFDAIGGIVDSVNSVLGFTAVVTAASASLVLSWSPPIGVEWSA